MAEYLHRPAALTGGVVLVAAMLLTVADVALRRTLNAPLRGAFELTELAMAGIAFLGLAHTQHLGEHITIDLLYERLPRSGRLALDRLSRLVSLVVAGAVTWQLLGYAGRVRAGGEVSGVLGLPVYPAVALACAGFGLFTLALLGDLLGEGRGRGA
jgi:TRAP-type C4-dicarboxylate transport system permease small subunit